MKYLFAIVFLISSVNLNGQMRFGRIFGINLSEMTMKSSGINVDPTNLAGIHFGGSLDIPVRGGFTFRPGAMFTSKGSMYDLDSVEYFLSPIYIEVPVNWFLALDPMYLKYLCLLVPIWHAVSMG